MLFEFDADQQALRRSVRDVLAKECTPALVRAVADETPGAGEQADALWRLYGELGWTELTDGADSVELAILLDELGRALDPTPFLATMSQFRPLAPDAGGPGQAGAAVLDGVTARPDGGGFVLDGTARYVVDGDRADLLAVVTDAGVFVVTADQVTATRDAVFDPVLHLADVAFDGVRVTEADRTSADPERARHVALTGLALTMVGACRRILELALGHVRTREQFGVKIGSFQAVQARAVDMHVAVERAGALGYFAALTIAEDDPRRRLAASMAKASAGECQDLVFRNGYQLFGAMGYTWENDLQFALKRAKAGELLLGGAAEHRALIAEVHDAARV